MIGKVNRMEDGLQILSGIYPKIQAEEIVREILEASWRGTEGIVTAKKREFFGRTFNAGPCPHVPKDSFERQRCPYNRIFKIQACCKNPPLDIGQ